MVSLPIEERLAFQGSMLRLLAERSTEADVRRVMETDAGYDPDVWKALAEIGAVGLLVDPEYGGAGAGPLELELVMEAVGAALLCSPLLTSGVLAAGLLQALGDAEANARLLPGIADGSRIATAALTGSAGTWTPSLCGRAPTARPGVWRVKRASSPTAKSPTCCWSPQWRLTGSRCSRSIRRPAAWR